VLDIKQLQTILTLFQTNEASEASNCGVNSFLIDAREEKNDVYALFIRRWADGGVRYKLLHSGSLPQRLISRFETVNVPVILFAHEGQVLDNFLNLVTNTNIAHEYVVLCEDNAIKHITTTTINTLSNRNFTNFSNSTTIKLYGRDNVVLEDTNLPCIVNLELFQNTRNNIVGIEIVSSDSRILHDKKWYRVECDDAECKMNLNMQLEVSAEDALYITSENPSFTIQSSPKPRVTGSIPDKLIVVFDRTCPDQDSWLDAYSLSVNSVSINNPVSIDKKPFNPGEEQQANKTSDIAVPPASIELEGFGAYNRNIRNQLGQAINSLMQTNSNVRLDAWWFADTHSEGLICGDIVLPPQSYGKIANQIVDTVFANCSYSPGIDLWDPIGETLEKALEENLNNSAVIIVGNSPPLVPSEVDSPIRVLLNASGFPITYRRKTCTLWHSVLKKADQKNVPVYYLFLTHQLDEVVQLRISDYLRYGDLASKVSASLAKCKLHLIEKPATTKGIEEGILEISNIIKARLDPISKVVINCE